MSDAIAYYVAALAMVALLTIVLARRDIFWAAVNTLWLVAYLVAVVVVDLYQHRLCEPAHLDAEPVPDPYPHVEHPPEP